jgi:hypothetical protein
MSEVMDRVMKRASQLLIVGAILMGATICVAIVTFVFFLMVSRNSQDSGLFIALGVLGLLALFLPLMMATYFAPALICLHEKTAVEALRLSLRACWRNFWPFTVLTLCALGLAIVATLPLLLGWFTAVIIRLATGSATVATVTAGGLMAATVSVNPDLNPSLLVLAIGAGSMFFSHINDAGVWMVKEFMGMSMPDMFKSWSMVSTIISVTALILTLALSLVL